MDPGALQNYHQGRLRGSAGEARTGASRKKWVRKGRERWRKLGVSDCKRETTEPDGLNITTGGVPEGEGKAVVFEDAENPRSDAKGSGGENL